MKLIDLLVQELPKRGGWPDGAVECQRFVDEATIDFYDENGNWDDDCTFTYGSIAVELVRKPAYPCESEQVTRDQYESALAASKKPAWNGEGVPPVGCECEYLDNNGKWYPVTIKYASDQLVVISGVTKIFGVEQGTEIAKDITIDKPQFRPLRTEAERKRDAAVEAIDFYMPEFITDTPNEFYHAKKIYDSIAAGKIPGVKLDD